MFIKSKATSAQYNNLLLSEPQLPNSFTAEGCR